MSIRATVTRQDVQFDDRFYFPYEGQHPATKADFPKGFLPAYGSGLALKGRRADGTLEFCVCDNGAGFDMARAAKLFQPFQRLHLPHEFSGLGIGLATARRIVLRHGGALGAQSSPGQGATFCFTLPDEAPTPTAL